MVQSLQFPLAANESWFFNEVVCCGYIAYDFVITATVISEVTMITKVTPYLPLSVTITEESSFFITKVKPQWAEETLSIHLQYLNKALIAI